MLLQHQTLITHSSLPSPPPKSNLFSSRFFNCFEVEWSSEELENESFGFSSWGFQRQCEEKKGLINVDYESEVEADILHIFRKGEDFNFGVEYVHLISFSESAYGAPVEDALASLEKLTEEFPSLIVQSTQGSNFNSSSDERTHAVVTRCRSLEAFDIFMSSTQYKDVWRSKFGAITKKTLPIHFSVDPVGKEIM